MSDLISREALCEYALNQKDKSITPNDIMRFPSAEPEKRTEERTETHACDLIDRQAAISLPVKPKEDRYFQTQNLDDAYDYGWYSLQSCIERLPSAQPEVLECGEGELIAQPEIIRCNDCKHWTQTTGNMHGFGLGDCDYINAKLVNCNGFCYWAERKTDGN